MQTTERAQGGGETNRTETEEIGEIEDRTSLRGSF